MFSNTIVLIFFKFLNLVSIFVQACSEESSHGVEFIYKEPKVTSLAELSERLTLQFSNKFGPGFVKIVSDTEQAEKGGRDEGGWVLVTHVTPYWEPAELAQRPTLFERTHHNVRHFMFDTPFTRDGPAQGGPAQQCKRRTILTSRLTSFIPSLDPEKVVVMHRVVQSLSH